MAKETELKPRTPAPQVEPVFSFPTPEKRDLMFWVEHNSDFPRNKVSQWAYGDLFDGPGSHGLQDYQLVFVTPQTPVNWERRFYVKDRWEEDAYNWENTTADLGGRKFDAVQRTYVTPRADYVPGTPAAGAAMPNVPAGLFSGYILVGKEQTRIGEQVLDSLYVAEVRTYIKRSTITQLGVDTLNGEALSSTTTLYYATEIVSGGLSIEALFAAPSNAFWGLLADGTQRVGEQLSDHWYAVTVETVVGGTFSGGFVTVDSYETTENYYWPPVLETIEFLDWVREDGGVDIYPAIRFEPEGYNGPCIAQITRFWKSTPFTDIVVPDQLLPTRIYYSCPFFTLNVSECLHTLVWAECDIGSGDPVYSENSGSRRYFSATSPTTWPVSLTAIDEQQPFRGGYLRTTMVIYSPVPPAHAPFESADST